MGSLLVLVVCGDGACLPGEDRLVVFSLRLHSVPMTDVINSIHSRYLHASHAHLPAGGQCGAPCSVHESRPKSS
jgi:hypothetical protein